VPAFIRVIEGVDPETSFDVGGNLVGINTIGGDQKDGFTKAQMAELLGSAAAPRPAPCCCFGAGGHRHGEQGLTGAVQYLARELAWFQPRGQQRGLELSFWVVDFPMFGFNSEEKRLEALHHPFCAPTR